MSESLGRVEGVMRGQGEKIAEPVGNWRGGLPKKEYSRRYYEANKEKVAETQRRYKEANKEKVAETKKELFGIDIKLRDCLRCSQPFMSRGVHNRICNKCNNMKAVYIVGSGS